jgi:ATP-dependent 26S proteasome regulatory subunit
MDPGDFDLNALADAAEGFTGAEIEEAIVSSRYLAGARGDGVTQEDLLGAVNRTFPVSVMRAESISALRDWARDRTVPA